MFKSLTFERGDSTDNHVDYTVLLDGTRIGYIRDYHESALPMAIISVRLPGDISNTSVTFKNMRDALDFIRCDCEKRAASAVLIDRVSWITAQIDPDSPSRSIPGPVGLFKDELAITLDSNMSPVIRSYPCITCQLNIHADNSITRVSNHA